jgi:hypothetical protein
MRYLKRGLVFILVLLGILACLLCASINGIIPIPCSAMTDSKIEQVFADMQVALEKADYTTAFRYMSPSYQQSHTPQDLLHHWTESMWFHLQPWYYLQITENQAKVYPRMCSVFSLMSGPIFDLIQIDGRWYFTGTYDWPLD